jgi:hypothetical protein
MCQEEDTSKHVTASLQVQKLAPVSTLTRWQLNSTSMQYENEAGSHRLSSEHSKTRYWIY